MFSVIFEVHPKEGKKDEYLGLAKVGLIAVLGTGCTVNVELYAHRLVRQQRRNDHCITSLAGELVGRVARAA